MIATTGLEIVIGLEVATAVEPGLEVGSAMNGESGPDSATEPDHGGRPIDPCAPDAASAGTDTEARSEAGTR